MSYIAKTPEPPYYAVVFTSLLGANDPEGYAKMANKMVELAALQPGFLGIESAREQVGITVSYWENLESIKMWKKNLEHMEAQKAGREKWYTQFRVRIAKIEKDYGMN